MEEEMEEENEMRNKDMEAGPIPEPETVSCTKCGLKIQAPAGTCFVCPNCGHQPRGCG